MISFLKGIIEDIEIGSISIDVNGVGYEVFMPNKNMENVITIGNEVKVFTYLNVKEDSMTLYGFMNKMDLELFNKLISVSGIGPKVALNIISAISAEELAAAIITEDVTKLTKLPGIGKKTAQRLVLELKDKFDTKMAICVSDNSVNRDDNVINEALCALTSLGYTKTKINSIIEKNYKEDISSEQLIKLVLKGMSTI